MKNENREVMRNILYAVETGGQVYGGKQYDNFTPAYTNSQEEHAITIGAGAWYATEAKRLLQRIRETDPAGFKEMDWAGISKDLDTAAWSIYKQAAGSEKANCISSIICSPVGIKCQDALMEQQIQEYEKSITEKYGTMPDGAMMECINIIHQGGSGALKRILGKTAKPYTAQSIYAALCTDPADTSNNNQVGDYVSRQKAVYAMIQKYCKEDTGMTENEVRQKVVDIMNGWIGLKRSDRSHMVIINLYNGCLPLARGYKVQPDDEYCATGASAAGIKAGLTDIIPRECSCGYLIQLFQKMGRWVENDAYVPDPADFVFYFWKDGADYATTDCTGWPDHVGVVAEVHKDKGYMIVTECNMSGGVVGQRKLTINGRYIRGYGIPDYASKSGTSTGTSGGNPSGGSANNSSGGINKTPQWVGQVTAASLPVRTWAGDSYDKIKSWPTLGKDNLVDVCDTIKASNGHAWYYIRIAGKFYGFVDSSYIKKADSSSGAGNASAPSYKVGKVYTLQVELRVRTAAGTSSPTKSYSQLTADGQRHDKDKDGCLDAGTQVTCQAIKNVGSDIWIKVPSGWIAAYYQGEIYVK